MADIPPKNRSRIVTLLQY